MLYDNDTFDIEGRTFKVSFPNDDCHGAPWEENDCHGAVSDLTKRGKRPGERVLCEDRGSKRYYDVQETIAIAKRDGWDAAPYGGSPGERAARAVEADFQYLRGWCSGDWSYVGVVVTMLDDDGEETGETEYVLGIESNSDEYLEQTAHELAGEILARVNHGILEGLSL